MIFTLSYKLMETRRDAVLKRKKHTAVIIEGNPHYINSESKQNYRRYYDEIKEHLHNAGYSDVVFDPGADYTTPPPADLWVGHSRGAGRLRFAPKGTRTLDITRYEDGIEEYEALMAKEMKKRGYKSVRDFPVHLRPVPGPEHHTLTQRAKEAIMMHKVGAHKSSLSEKTSALRDDVELRPHQAEALKVLDHNKGRAIFAHGTGTGKTLTSIAAFEQLKSKGEAKKALVVAPASLLTNFREQGVGKFTDSTISAVGGDGDYQLISLEKFRRDPQDVLSKAKADTIIIDEIHRSRNPASSSFEALRTATRDKGIKNVIGLTGSIVSNHPKDIVPLADIVHGEHHLGSQGRFTKDHVKVDKISGGFLRPPSSHYNLSEVRRLKEKMDGMVHYIGNTDMEGMPELDIKDVPVEMSEEQQKLYDFAMGKLNPLARDRIRSGLPPSQSEAQHIFGMITKLRQASNSLGTHKNISPGESAEQTPKLKRVMDDVQEHLKSTKDGQAVIYSNLVSGGAKELYEGLKARGLEAGLYTGVNKDLKVTKKSRDEDVKKFLEGKKRAIILTGAGNEGISLNNATFFAAVDPHFNPERNWQAVARARRFGGLSHRKKKDRVLQVRRYQSVPKQTWLGRKLFGKEFGVDAWMQGVADEKDRLNNQVRDVSSKVNPNIKEASVNILRQKILTKVASRDKKDDPLLNDPLLKEFVYRHRNLYGTPMENLDLYRNVSSKLNKKDKARFDKMYESRHGYVPNLKQSIQDQKELEFLERLEKGASKTEKGTADVRKDGKLYRPKVQAFMYDDLGRVLASKSQGAGSALRSFANYKFPGGGVELGESILDAARKELLEETGYDVGDGLFEFGTPTAVDWDDSFREQARKKGRGQYAGQYEYYAGGPIGKKNKSLFGSEGDQLEDMEFVPLSQLRKDLTGTATDPNNEYSYFDKQKLVALDALEKEMQNRQVKTSSRHSYKALALGSRLPKR